MTDLDPSDPTPETGSKGESENEGSTEKKGGAIWFIIAVVAIVVILLVIALMLMVFRKKSKVEAGSYENAIGANNLAQLIIFCCSQRAADSSQ